MGNFLKFMKKHCLVLCIFALIFAVGFVACEDEGGGEKNGDKVKNDPNITNVTITQIGGSVEVSRGSYENLTARVIGKAGTNPVQTVKWEIASSGHKAGTRFDTAVNGKLYVAADETKNELQ